MKLVSYVMGMLCAPLLLSTTIRAYDEFDIEDALYRIEKHIALIDHYNKNNDKLQNRSRALRDCPDHNCSHELIKLCIKRIDMELCLDPVVETWHMFKTSFAQVDPELFVREFTSVLFGVYHQSIQALAAPAPKASAAQQVSIADIINLYNEVSSLPIVQVLDALDKLYVALNALMLKHGIKADTDWSEWLAANWWVPPVVVGSFLYSLLQRPTKTLNPSTLATDPSVK